MGMLETCTRLWRGGTVVPHRTPQARHQKDVHHVW